MLGSRKARHEVEERNLNHAGTCPTPPRQVLAAGIEANIPVTYGIGSQRGDGALAVNS